MSIRRAAGNADVGVGFSAINGGGGVSGKPKKEANSKYLEEMVGNNSKYRTLRERLGSEIREPKGPTPTLSISLLDKYSSNTC